MLRKIGLHSHRTHDSSVSASDEPYPRQGLGFDYDFDAESAPPQQVEEVSSYLPGRSTLHLDTRQSRRRGAGSLIRSPSNANSTFPGIESATNPASQHADPLGLHLVHDNVNPFGDIIFVHGLGGTARKTWSWERNVNHFWPAWLTEEDGLESYRIFTYGYNSDFKGAGTNLNIIDFAKDLLFQMLVFSTGSEESCISIGQQPIIFVAHSMGGLVVKKAYVLGKHDDRYAYIIAKTHGIMFLATPHRGAQYAKMLNSILLTAPFGAPPKAYVDDLDTHSRTLQDINEQFRISCGQLSLVSFFETLKTSFGITKSLIVEKESGILGYPQEISNPLNADHHTICKFRSREDANYISVMSMLRLWALKSAKLNGSRPSLQARASSNTCSSIHDVEAVLGVRERAEDELRTFRTKALTGTCQWITQKENFINWIKEIQNLQGPSVFWLEGQPAMGKSVIASHVISHLTSGGTTSNCQYHFFSASHQSKRTAAYCLRSIAAQLALVDSEFRSDLLAFTEADLSFTSQSQNFGDLWEKIFEGIIFKLRRKTFYWILDGLDEADAPAALMSSLIKIRSLTPIKIFITSRPARIPSSTAMNQSIITSYAMTEDDTVHDIQRYVDNVISEALPNDDQRMRDDIVQQIRSKAGGSFLWVSLALETLQDNWHTQEDIRKSLTEIPNGMECLYDRMLSKIEAQSPRSQLLAHRILTWTTCSWRPLSIAELQMALQPEFSGFVRLQETILQICGNFISINNGKVSLIHTTARQFLINNRQGSLAFIDSGRGHEHIAITCLRFLSDEKWKRIYKSVDNSDVSTSISGSRKNRLIVIEKEYPFLGYAVCYYAYHVSSSSADSERLPEVLNTFLLNHCLSWIEAIALSGNLRYLTRSARHLKTFSKRRSRNSRLTDNFSSLTLMDNSDGLGNTYLWAVDFIRIVGKFGLNMIQRPSSVYRIVAPLCPKASMIGTMYGSQARSLSVTGLPSEGWDDCLATVTVAREEAASMVLATNAFFLILLGSSGTVIVWSAETCEELRRIEHDEYVASMVVDRSHTFLATAGTHSYRIWDLASGKPLYRFPKATDAITMAMAFSDLKSELMIGHDDCSVTSYDYEALTHRVHFTLPVTAESSGCPLIMALSPDLTKLAVAWRGRLPVIWDISNYGSHRPMRCRAEDSIDGLFSPLEMQWQVDSNSILILCHNTKLVEWHIYDDEQIEFDHIKPQDMAISHDGNFLITSDHRGTISIFNFPRLSMIYQLVNENEYIEDLAFSPDGQRFYDLRGSTCNIWEPDALVRPDEAELEDRGSSIMTEPVIVRDGSSQSHVTALVYGSADRYYCAGREDGTVYIHDAYDGRKVRKVYSHSSHSSVIVLSWSPSGKYLISGDDSGRIIAKRLEAKESNKFGVFAVFDFRVGEPVQQFVFDRAERLVLISTACNDIVWDLKIKKEVSQRRREYSQGSKWIQHPHHSELLLRIDASAVQTYQWEALDRDDAKKPISAGTVSKNTAHHGDAVHWVALTSNKQYIVYLATTVDKRAEDKTKRSIGLHLEFLSTSDLHNQQPHSPASDCKAELASQIRRLVGIYQDRIVFLDHDYWLCTWSIGGGLDDVKRHFYLPKDWLNHNSLQMATINSYGTFFCPKHGNVAIVRNGMRF